MLVFPTICVLREEGNDEMMKFPPLSRLGKCLCPELSNR